MNKCINFSDPVVTTEIVNENISVGAPMENAV